MKKKNWRPIAAAIVAWSAMHAKSAHAVDTTWDGNLPVGTIGDGASWSDPNNWTLGGVVDTLPDAGSPGDDITFSGGATGPINLQSDRIASSLYFAGDYTLDTLANHHYLNVTSGNIGVAAGASVTINSWLDQSSGLTKYGAGTLTMGDALYGFSTTVAQGTLAVVGNTFGSGPVTVQSAGTLALDVDKTLFGNVTNYGTVNIAAGTTTSSSSSTTTFEQMGTLNIAGTLNLQNCTFNYDGGTVNGTVNMGSGCKLELGPGAGGSGTFVLSGATTLTTTLNNPLIIPAGVTVHGLAGGTIYASGATNMGNVIVDRGSLGLNGAFFNSGTLSTVDTGTGFAAMIEMSGPLTNNSNGTIDINYSTDPEGNCTNMGQVNIAAGATLFQGAAGGTYKFTQAAGALNIAGSMQMNGGTFIYSGGRVNGTVTFPYVGPITPTATLELDSGAGPSGTFVFNGMTNQLTTGPLNTGIVVPSGVTIQFAPGGGTGSSLTFESNVTNNGTIVFTGSSTGLQSIYENSIGGVTNFGLVSVTPGSATLDLSVNGSLVNEAPGVFNVGSSLELVGNLTNSGTINIAAGQTLSVFNSSIIQMAGTLNIVGELTRAKSFQYIGGNVLGTVKLGQATANLVFGPGAGNSGSFIVTSASSTVNPFVGTSMTVPFGVKVEFESVGASASDTFTAACTNNGELDFEASQNQQVGFSGLSNWGTITVASAGGAAYTTSFQVTQSFINMPHSVLNVNSPLAITGTVTNQGSIHITGGATLSLAGFTSFTQAGGSITVDPSGVFDMSVGTLNANGGTISLASDAAAPAELKLHALVFNALSGMGTIFTTPPTAGQLPGFVDMGGKTVTFSVADGTAPVDVTIAAPIANGSVNKTEAGTLLFSTVNTYQGDTTVSGGTLQIGPAGSIASSGVNVLAGGNLVVSGSLLSTATLTATGSASFVPSNAGGDQVRSLGAVNVSGSGAVSLVAASSNAARQVLITGALSFGGATDAWVGQLDLGNGDLIVHNGVLADIANQIRYGYNSGAWNGGGIDSSSAITASPKMALGYGTVNGTFDGQTVTASDVVVKYTLVGDADLNGSVNFADLLAVAQNYSGTNTNWGEGDFNYDGTTNFTDLLGLAQNYSKAISGLSALQVSQLDAAGGASFAGAFAQAEAQAAVPEPGVLSLLGIGAVGALSRKRRELNRLR